MAATAICDAHTLPLECVQIVPMLASGDKIQDRPLAEIGGKALWTKELERALLQDEIDIAVHSMKDVETIRPDSFVICAMLPRADIRDRLIGAETIASLPKAATVGTSSPRRAAQLLHIRPDLKIVSIRGNVATRLSKIESGEVDATLLAAAGLDRLSMADVGAAISIGEMLPAASQGAIGLDCLTRREDIRTLAEKAGDKATFEAVLAERRFLAALGGDCHSAVAAHAFVEDSALWLRGEILRSDGGEKQAGKCLADNMDDIDALAEKLLAAASETLRAQFSK